MKKTFLLAWIIQVFCLLTNKRKPCLAKETEYFLFYSNTVLVKHDMLFKFMENEFLNLCRKYSVNVKNKITVTIYCSIRSFHTALNAKNAAEWFSGAFYKDRIMLVSPFNPGKAHTYESIFRVAKHELTHLILYQINNDIPVWLNEGLAAYEAQQMTTERIIFLKRMIRTGTIPTIKELEIDFVKNNGFQFSYTIIDFLLSNYNTGILLDILKTPSAFYTLLDMTAADFHKKWTDFLIKKYALMIDQVTVNYIVTAKKQH